MSNSEHEMSAMASDVEYDEETGLTTEERRKYIHQQRQQRRLDRRIAGVDAALASSSSPHPLNSTENARQADRYVIRRLAVNVVLIGLWYFFSLSISLYNTWMFSKNKFNFPFPLFTTSLHMVVQFILASTVLLVFPSLRPQSTIPSSSPSASALRPRSRESLTRPKPALTPLFYVTRLVPTGVTTSLDIGLGNTSLRYITLTFYTMCKSSVLIFVLIFAFLFRLESPSWRLIAIILTMTIGVLMMVFGETAFNALGFVLAISASFFSGFRWAVTQILLLRHPATSNPFATLFLLAPIMFVTLFSIALVSETPTAVLAALHSMTEKEGLGKVLVLMFIPGCLAFCMISAEFTLLQRTNVVTLSICGIFKEVVTIAAAEIAFHDKLSVLNACGLLVTIVSIGAYNYLKVTKMRKEARDRLLHENKKVDDLEDLEGDDEDLFGSRRESRSGSGSGGNTSSNSSSGRRRGSQKHPHGGRKKSPRAVLGDHFFRHAGHDQHHQHHQQSRGMMANEENEHDTDNANAPLIYGRRYSRGGGD